MQKQNREHDREGYTDNEQAEADQAVPAGGDIPLNEQVVCHSEEPCDAAYGADDEYRRV